MTVTIDGKTLNVVGGSLMDNTKAVGSFVDQWKNETYGKRAKIIGSVNALTFMCYEDNVDWDVSVAKYLKGKVRVDEAVTFSMDLGNMHAIDSTYVTILDVTVTYKQGATETNFVRFFALKLQEAPS